MTADEEFTERNAEYVARLEEDLIYNDLVEAHDEGTCFDDCPWCDEE